MGNVPRQSFSRNVGVVAFGHLRFEISKSSTEGLMVSVPFDSETLKLRFISSESFEFRRVAMAIWASPFGWMRTYSTALLSVSV